MPDPHAHGESSDDLSSIREALERIRALGGPALVRDLVALFEPDAERTLGEAREAAARGDGAELARALHALKSGCGQLGARTLHAECERGERLAARGMVDEGAAVLGDVERRLGALRAAVHDWLGAEGSEVSRSARA